MSNVPSLTRITILTLLQGVTVALLVLLGPALVLAESSVPAAQSPDGVWEVVENVEFPPGYRPPRHFTAFKLDRVLLEALLADAPRETFGVLPSDVFVSIPMPHGGFGLAPVVETRMMETELATLFPEIRTYLYVDQDGDFGGHLGLGPDRVVIAGKADGQLVRVDPVETDNGTVYLSYLSRDAHDDGAGHVHPPVGDGPPDDPPPIPQFGSLNMNGVSNVAGQQLKIYRLAATTTGEFYQARGGSDANVLFSLVADILGTNAVFESEIAVRLILSSATWDLLYSNPATDPFDNAPPRCSISGNACTTDADCDADDSETCDVRTPCQLRVDNRDNLVALHNGGVVDQSQYDLGVLFGVSHPGARGGCAWYNVCLTGAGVNHKGAAAVSAGGDPTGTNSTSGVLAHEVGHQLGARHTFSGMAGSCTLNEFLAGATGPNGENQSGYEPGSGTTRMSYRGSCSDEFFNDNVDTSSDPPADSYMHSVSFDEIIETIHSGHGAACGTVVATANLPPLVGAGPDYTIPRQTPFKLIPEFWLDEQPLTFNWEQFDLPTIVTGLAANDTRRPIDLDLGDGPIIRSMPPGDEPVRVVPRLTDLLAGIQRRGEILPQVDRELNFRFIARDNQMAGGGVAYDSMKITVAGEPFFITSPNSGVFQASCEVPLTWEVGGGDVADFVSVKFSSDGGLNFDTVIADVVPNTGSYAMTVPCEAGVAGRIELAAVDNIFFDINDQDLTVFQVPPVVHVEAIGGSVDDACEFTVEFSATATHNCSLDAADLSVQFFKAQENYTLGEPQYVVSQVDAAQVSVAGSVLVSDLLGSPAQLAVSVTAVDACGGTTTGFAEAVVVDDTPPEIDVELNPTLLWPPNHKMIPITAQVEVTDNCPGVSFVLSSVVSNEPDNDIGDGNTDGDIQDAEFGTPDTSFSLRAERSGTGDGRIYTVTYTATDGSDNEASETAQVTVPIHR